MLRSRKRRGRPRLGRRARRLRCARGGIRPWRTLNVLIQLAPENLEQSILPGWQFSLFSVNLGDSSDPAMEKAAIQKVGSYGKQIGHLAEALEVVIERLGLLELGPAARKEGRPAGLPGRRRRRQEGQARQDAGDGVTKGEPRHAPR